VSIKKMEVERARAKMEREEVAGDAESLVICRQPLVGSWVNQWGECGLPLAERLFEG
jgi:hypothetical protein